MTNHTNTTELVEYFTVGWFRYPKDLDVNYDLLQLLYFIIAVASLPLNAVFLAMIIKNPGKKTWTNMGIILASMCLLHLAVNGMTTVNQVYKIYHGDQTTLIDVKVIQNVLQVAFTKYYFSAFLLAFITYALIVKPLLYKALAPKPRNMVFIILGLWLAGAAVFWVLPLLIDDEIVRTISVSVCWLTTFVIAMMYIKILTSLRRRKRKLQRTLNVSASRQGLLVIKQNAHLAMVLFIYLLFLVVMTLPIATCLFLLNNCPRCNNPVTKKLLLHLIPVAMLQTVLFPVHWLFGTPQYYAEMKRLGSKLITCFKH